MLFTTLSSLAQNEATNELQIRGVSGQPITLKAPDLAAMPRITFRAKERDSTEHTYTGVSLSALLARVKAPLGRQLGGKALANYLLAEAADGYQVVFALPELDSLFARQVIFLADQRDGQPLPTGQGPYRIIVPQETKQARWVRQVIRLSVLTAK